MYNEYGSNNFYHNQFNNTYIEPVLTDIQEVTEKKSLFSFPEITTETLILLAVIYFSVYDELDTEMLLILGALFFLGI